MDAEIGKMCRLCLKTLHFDFVTMDNITIQMVEVLFLKTDLSLPKTPLMCITCSRIVKKSFHFKAICLSTEEKISCLADAKQVTVVDMRQLYLMENSISDTQSYKNYNVCRFCMISLENHCFVKLNSLMDDIGPGGKMLGKCFPEADFGIIKNPVVCNLCIEHLKDYLNFARNCYYKEIQIKNLLKGIVTNNGSQVDNYKFKSDVGSQANEEANKFKTQQEAETEFNPVKIEAAGSDLKTSTATTANREKLLHCDCGFKTDFLKRLKRHQRKGKNEEETYKCQFCTFPLKSRTCLKLHLKSHKDKQTGLYTCPRCEFSTEAMHRIEHHLKHYAKSQKEKLFTCNLCCENFKTQNGLRTHINSHEGKFYRCSFCEKVFKTKLGLGNHMWRHIEKHYKCSICQYKSKNQHDMKLHTDIEHRENPLEDVSILIYRLPKEPLETTTIL